MKRLFATLLVTVLVFSLLGLPLGASATSGETVEINMSYFADAEGAAQLWAYYFELLAERYPNYKVNFEMIPTTGPEEIIRSKIAGGDFPDLIYVWQPALLIDGGIIQEIPKELEDMLLTPNDFKVDGKLYTMPLHT